MFQMKFYAVALLRSRGVLPARLRLLYLADSQVLDFVDMMRIWRLGEDVDPAIADQYVKIAAVHQEARGTQCPFRVRRTTVRSVGDL